MPALPLYFDTEQVACLANSTMCTYSILLLHMYKHVYLYVPMACVYYVYMCACTYGMCVLCIHVHLYLWHVCIMYMVIDATWKAIMVRTWFKCSSSLGFEISAMILCSLVKENKFL